ncbi:YggS family pyridoxal phosphate-dependent enzyme [Cytophagales bacterium LB-30]|uniref:Pyridoxal phosphate homeostasis protein n=1 Tax=Shiella aurantiaca TaxID=3058365 RepID=A0ABT8F194_9BACT|nr:YggS family pyridoxal phosphate-dependent enzyme [Shiella aurantiaca]MDN4164221.1 YggS family pyridoxal phosphate-dependent enzyme [Shiella aurantiaca]
MSVADNLDLFRSQLSKFPQSKLVAVSKTKPIALLEEAYQAGQRHFGENKVQEMTEKAEKLPKDIQWHMIGHLQSNKVKYLAPYVYLIHSVDSLKLLKEIDKQAAKNHQVISCLLQVYIAKEESKFGLDEAELRDLLLGDELPALAHIKIVGFMGMATNTENQQVVRNEFRYLKELFDHYQREELPANVTLKEISMGMSGDYQIALEEGSTLIRVGSAIFGERNYL